MSFGSHTPINVMVDLETLGTAPGCKILSIGAVTFLHEGELNKFYTAIDVSSQDKYNLNTDLSTLNWWASQPDRARAEAFNGTEDLFQVLTWFSSWLKSISSKPILWGNAARFDLAILEAAYKAVDLPVPWKYFDEMCFRTLKTLYRGTVTEPEFKGHRHNALNDAIHQAKWAHKIYNYQMSLMGLKSELGEDLNDS